MWKVGERKALMTDISWIRFWYENPWVFRPEQLSELRRVSLGSILCENGDNITHVTKDVFVLPQEQSPSFVPCETIPKLDLRHWTECCTGRLMRLNFMIQIHYFCMRLDCRNAGFFNSLHRSAPQRFRRSTDFSFKEDKEHEIFFPSSANESLQELNHINFNVEE